MDILGGDVSEIDLIDYGAHLDIMRHPWWSYKIVYGKVRVGVEHGFGIRLSQSAPMSVLLTDFLHDLEQTRAPPCAIYFQSRRHSKTYRFLSARLIGYDEARVERIKATFHTLYGSVETLEVDGNILPLFLHNQPVTCISGFTSRRCLTNPSLSFGEISSGK